MSDEPLSPNNKALRLNLDDSQYGTLAEIGGGQEVARVFFKAGGASGTIAKTISAYDKSFSDEIYNWGYPGRYVSETRVDKMLHREYTELTGLLEQSKDTCFFAFANSVETLNYSKSNRPHGWVGMRFQLEKRSEPNHVMLHVRLLENESHLQQTTLGVLGVNLIYAVYNYYDRPNTFLSSLMDNLSPDRVQITMVRMSGPELSYVDNRLLAVQLVNNGMTHAIMFDRYGNVQEPDDMLYKKNVLAFRGRFRPITYATLDIIRSSFRIFKRDEDYQKSNTLTMCEITLNHLTDEGHFNEKDFLDRVDQLNKIGQNVMISDFREFYKLVQYFSQFRIKNLRLVLGLSTFLKVLDPQYYHDLKGGVLEAFGKLFTRNMKMYIYPSLDPESGKLLTTKNVRVPGDLEYLYRYLVHNRKILGIDDYREKKLSIFSGDVIKRIDNKDPSWEEMVPKLIVNTIKRKKMFGYSEDISQE
ncbi:MAG: hypothetical protein K9I68_04440 [Bacteroidales bacterium]|nr:hypothetical protein [Bacteroidales bacterium]MCF8338202.1 hypothetical protein [Bacteroidales bacterium]